MKYTFITSRRSSFSDGTSVLTASTSDPLYEYETFQEAVDAAYAAAIAECSDLNQKDDTDFAYVNKYRKYDTIDCLSKDEYTSIVTVCDKPSPDPELRRVSWLTTRKVLVLHTPENKAAAQDSRHDYDYWRENIMDKSLSHLDAGAKVRLYLRWVNGLKAA